MEDAWKLRLRSRKMKKTPLIRKIMKSKIKNYEVYQVPGKYAMFTQDKGIPLATYRFHSDAKRHYGNEKKFIIIESDEKGLEKIAKNLEKENKKRY